MFGRYKLLKKMYINLLKSQLNKIEPGYLYLMTMPGADKETVRSIAKTISMALEHKKMNRTLIVITGHDVKEEVRIGMPPVPLPPEPKNGRKKR